MELVTDAGECHIDASCAMNATSESTPKIAQRRLLCCTVSTASGAQSASNGSLQVTIARTTVSQSDLVSGGVTRSARPRNV